MAMMLRWRRRRQRNGDGDAGETLANGMQVKCAQTQGRRRRKMVCERDLVLLCCGCIVPCVRYPHEHWDPATTVSDGWEHVGGPIQRTPWPLWSPPLRSISTQGRQEGRTEGREVSRAGGRAGRELMRTPTQPPPRDSAAFCPRYFPTFHSSG